MPTTFHLQAPSWDALAAEIDKHKTIAIPGVSPDRIQANLSQVQYGPEGDADSYSVIASFSAR